MPSPLETWFSEIPPITRIYVSAACLTSIAVQLGFVHPLQLWLNYESIVHDFQWWRLITNFFYFGPLSIDFCFHVFFLARYSRMMEEGFFRNKPADYVWLMVFSASVLIILSIIVPFAYLPFMGSALSFTMVYIWARRNPYVRLNFLGLLVFTAPYLPWVLLIFSLCLGGQVPVGDILGVLVGHIYYFFEDVWPREPMSNGKKYLATPRFIQWLVEGNRPRDDSIEIPNTTAAEPENIVLEDTQDTEEIHHREEIQHTENPQNTEEMQNTEETHRTGEPRLEEETHQAKEMYRSEKKNHTEDIDLSDEQNSSWVNVQADTVDPSLAANSDSIPVGAITNPTEESSFTTEKAQLEEKTHLAETLTSNISPPPYTSSPNTSDIEDKKNV